MRNSTIFSWISGVGVIALLGSQIVSNPLQGSYIPIFVLFNVIGVSGLVLLILPDKKKKEVKE